MARNSDGQGDDKLAFSWGKMQASPLGKYLLGLCSHYGQGLVLALVIVLAVAVFYPSAKVETSQPLEENGWQQVK